MQHNKLYTSFGTSRAEHAANIAMATESRAKYADFHKEVFASNNLKKFVVVNAEGKILGKFGKSQEAAALVVNADGTVRHEDFLVIQDKIVEVRRRALNGITDLMAGGLSFPVSISDQLIGFENVNEFQDAKQEMNPNSYQNNDTVFTESFVPNPITHQSFQVPWRQTGFDYKRSLGISESTRQVAERLEETLFNGNTDVVVSFNGANQPLFGYTTDPDRGTGTISDWTLTANVEKVVDEIIDEVGDMRTNQGGVGINRVMLYVSNDFWPVFQKDYKAEVSGTIMERVKKIAEILDVKPAEKLASKTAVLVEMEARTVELAVATDIIAVPHVKTNPMSPTVLTTYAAMVQQIKVDSNGNTGIRHLTT